MSRHLTASVAVTCALALTAIALFAHCDEGRDAPRRATPERRGEHTAAPAAIESDVEREEALSTMPARPVGSPTDSRADANSVSIEGVVVTEDNRLVFERFSLVCHVPVEGPREDPGSLPRTETHSTRTSTDGRFVLEVPEDRLGAIGVAILTDGTGEEVFRGNLRLQEFMALVISPRRVLHGTVRGLPSDCPTPRLEVTRQTPVGVEYLARGRLAADSTFAMSTRTRRPDAPVRLSISCPQAEFVLDTTLGSLTSASGFDGVLQLCTHEILVVDEGGSPIAGASVRAAADDSSLIATAAHDSTDESGRAHITTSRLRPSSAAVAHPGFRARILPLPCRSPTEFHTIVLRELATGDIVEGRVEDHAGRAIEGAFVSATAAVESGHLTNDVFASMRSDDRGRFALQLAVDGSALEVSAFSKAHGLDTVEVVPPVHDLVIRLQGCQYLRIDGAMAQPQLTTRGGAVEWLVWKKGAASADAGSGTLPLSVGPLGPGSYSVAVYWPSEDLYAEARADVGCHGPQPVVTCHFTPARWFAGAVSPAPDAPCVVRCLHPDWPNAIREHWGSSHCAADGSFRVMCGSLQHGTLVAYDASGAEIGRVHAPTGSDVSIALR